MIEQKWNEIYNKENHKWFVKRGDVVITPQNWSEVREYYLDFVQAMDEATEVYNLENEVK